MWKDLSKEWQITFEQAWEAFKQGSIPIGAMITDTEGNVVITGRNATCEKRYPNSRTAHAEMECMHNLDIERHPAFKEYILYSTMEPCPMCMGTITIGGIHRLRVAAKDRYCGALHYAKDDPYVRSKQMEICLEEGEMEAVQIAQQAYHELRRYNGELSKVLKEFQLDCPKSIEVALKMYHERYLDKCVEQNMLYSEVYDSICQMLG